MVRHRLGVAWLNVAMAAAVAAVAAAILVPVFLRAQTASLRSECISNLKRQAAAFSMYQADCNGQFPQASAWMDGLDMYVKSDTVYHCPFVGGSDYGYAMNSALSQASFARLQADPRTIPQNYDSTNLARNANDAFTSLPTQPERRNVAYADGHVGPGK